MGYKTTDYAEKERLEKEGYTVIALRGIPFSGPEYEFNFDKEESEKEPAKCEEPPAPEEIKEPPKKRGNPNWLNRGKK